MINFDMKNEMAIAVLKHMAKTTDPGKITDVDSRLLNDFQDILGRALTCASDDPGILQKIVPNFTKVK